MSGAGIALLLIGIALIIAALGGFTKGRDTFDMPGVGKWGAPAGLLAGILCVILAFIVP